MIFFYVPVFIAMIINFACFIYTVATVFKTQRNNSMRTISIRYTNNKNIIKIMRNILRKPPTLEEISGVQEYKIWNCGKLSLVTIKVDKEVVGQKWIAYRYSILKVFLFFVDFVCKDVLGSRSSMGIWEYPLFCSWSSTPKRWMSFSIGNILQDNRVFLLHKGNIFLSYICM